MSNRTFRWVIVIGLAALVVLNAAWLWRIGPRGGDSTAQVSREVERQMREQLPKTMAMGGNSFTLGDVHVTKVTQGEKGYYMDIEIKWEGGPGATTITQISLLSNGMGRYNFDSTFGEFGHMSFSIPG